MLRNHQVRFRNLMVGLLMGYVQIVMRGTSAVYLEPVKRRTLMHFPTFLVKRASVVRTPQSLVVHRLQPSLRRLIRTIVELVVMTHSVQKGKLAAQSHVFQDFKSVWLLRLLFPRTHQFHHIHLHQPLLLLFADLITETSRDHVLTTIHSNIELVLQVNGLQTLFNKVAIHHWFVLEAQANLVWQT